MPLYEYRCPEGHDFEKFYRSINAAPIEERCPFCGEVGSPLVRGWARFQGFGLLHHRLRQGRKRKRSAKLSAIDREPSQDGQGGKAKAAKTSETTTPAVNRLPRRSQKPRNCSTPSPAPRPPHRLKIQNQLPKARQRMNAPEMIRAELARAARELGAGDVEPIIERPRDPSLGDWASNIAMALARPLASAPPRSPPARSNAISRMPASRAWKSPGRAS